MVVLNKLTKYQIHHILISIIILFLSQLILNYVPFQLPSWNRMIIAILLIGIYFILTSVKIKKISTLNVFTTIMCMGTIVCLIKPVQFGFDEETHLSNTLNLADSFVLKKEKTKLHDYDKVFEHDILRNSSGYKGDDYWFNAEHEKSDIKGNIIGVNNIAYLPAAIGWKIGTILSKKIVVSYYLGRIFNLLAFAILATLAFRISKYYRLVIYLFSCLPFSILLCSSYQYDNLYLGISLLIIALLTNYYVDNESIDVKNIIIFNLICFMFSFSKIPFILLGSLLIFYPSSSFRIKNGRLISLIVFFVQVLLSFSIMRLNNMGKVHLIVGEIPSIGFFIKHPLPMIRTFFDIFPNSIEYIANPIVVPIVPARFLSMLTTVFLIAIIVLLSANLDFRLKRVYQIGILGLFIVISFAIIYAISGDLRVYKMGDLNVGGVQGRYFFFMILSMPALLSNDIQKYVSRGKHSMDNLLFYSLAYLNVLTIGVTIYSQIAHVL